MMGGERREPGGEKADGERREGMTERIQPQRPQRVAEGSRSVSTGAAALVSVTLVPVTGDPC